MKTYVLRVWLPDRPGALGAVASRIGSVRGDLVGIDILERGAGRVIDELVIELPSADLLPLLLSEVGEVDGVDVEDARALPESVARPDPRLDALESAREILEQDSVDALDKLLVAHATRDFEADWAAVVDVRAASVVSSVGNAPSGAWLAAFVGGGRSSGLVAEGGAGPDDVAWVLLSDPDAALALGRSGRPFRARERRQLSALGRIAELRRAELT